MNDIKIIKLLPTDYAKSTRDDKVGHVYCGFYRGRAFDRMFDQIVDGYEVLVPTVRNLSQNDAIKIAERFMTENNIHGEIKIFERSSNEHGILILQDK